MLKITNNFTYLVLGSEGQIGNPLVNWIKRQGDTVIEHDIKRTDLEDIRLLPPNSERKEHLLRNNIKNCDFIFFLAWDVGGSKYLSNAEKSYDLVNNNILIMKSVFSLLKEYNKPFIFTSSQMSNMIHSTYGNTKLIGEKYTRALNGLSVKLWNVYGYEKVDKKSHVITDFINMALEDNHINMRTDGSEERQFLYVEDCCNALYTLSKSYNKISREQDYHISSGEWLSIEKIASIISNLTNSKYTKGSYVDNVQMNMKLEPNDSMKNIWNPKYNIKEGIEILIKKIKLELNK